MGINSSNGIRSTAASRQIRNKPTTDTPPAGLFASPLKGATRPRELLSVVKTAYGTKDLVDEAAARGANVFTCFMDHLKKRAKHQ